MEILSCNEIKNKKLLILYCFAALVCSVLQLSFTVVGSCQACKSATVF
ncbi:hypothetical protein [Methanimicrococcus hongohii]|nr:hypothetical protein [Methanimicrococcus sp. Hf6]